MSGAGLTLPPAGGRVSDETVAFAAELTDRSGKAPVIEAALARRTGRPRPLPVRAVLAALVCLALDDRPLFLTEATRLLFCQLSPASRRLLGVPGTATTQRAFLAAYRRVRYCFAAICPAMDPSALPKNRRLSEQDLAAGTRKMTPAQIQAARGRLEAFINSLIEASVSVLADEERAAFDGCTGLDATPVPLFSRGPALTRTAQEALVNAAKHAPHQSVGMRLDYAGDHTSLAVTNHLGEDALGDHGPELATVNGGYGLAGMRERLLLVGGTLSAGRNGSDWAVMAEVPQ